MVKMRQRHLAVFEFEQGADEEIINYIKNNIDFIKNHCLAFHNDISMELKELLKELNIDFFRVYNKSIFKNSKNYQQIKDSMNNTQNKHENLITKKISFNLDDSEQVVMKTIESKINENKDNDKDLSTENINNKIKQDLKIDLNLQELKLFGKNVFLYKPLSSLVFNRSIRSGEDLVLHSNAIFLLSINVGAIIKSYGNLHIYGKCDGILECFGDYIIIKEFSMGRISLKGIDLEGKVLEIVKNSTKLKMITIEDNSIKVCEF